MKHAFLILTYSQPEQVLRQVQLMMDADRHFYVHINRRTIFGEDNAAYQTLLTHPQVTLVQDRIKVMWGSYSAVEAHLALIRTALAGPPADYFHLISGECLPVKKPEDFNAYLEPRKGTQYILLKEMPKSRKDAFGWGPNRIDKFHLYSFFDPRSPTARDRVLHNINTVLRISQRFLKIVGIYRRYSAALPALHVGSVWWSLTPDCCAWIVRFLNENPKLVRRFQHTQYPEEMIFQTAIMSGPHREFVVHDNVRFMKFDAGGSHALHLDIGDVSTLQSPNILIARKFTRDSEALIQHLIDAGILNAVPD